MSNYYIVHCFCYYCYYLTYLFKKLLLASPFKLNKYSSLIFPSDHFANVNINPFFLVVAPIAAPAAVSGTVERVSPITAVQSPSASLTG